MKAIAFLAGLAVILLVGLLAVIGNQQEVTVTYFFGQSWTGALWVALIAAFGIGGLVVGLFMSIALMKNRVSLGLLSMKAARLEEELNAIKQRPRPDEHPVYKTPSGALPVSTGDGQAGA